MTTRNLIAHLASRRNAGTRYLRLRSFLISEAARSTTTRLARLTAAATAAIALTAGCGSDSSQRKVDPVVAVVAGTPIHRSQLDRAVAHARAAAKRAHTRFPEAGTPRFRRARHAILEQLVLNVEIFKAANRLHVAVPTAAVYEFAEEQGEEAEGGESSEKPKTADDPAYVRSTVRARLLYEAVGRKVAAAARVRPEAVERYYRAHRAGLERVAGSPARARLYAETVLLRRRQAAMMRSWLSALQRRFRPRVHYSEGY
jgi:SurA N-terminal domain